ncbi:hypothetical protein E2I00_009784, partial [Balaenoptera physalus]
IKFGLTETQKRLRRSPEADEGCTLLAVLSREQMTLRMSGDAEDRFPSGTASDSPHCDSPLQRPTTSLATLFSIIDKVPSRKTVGGYEKDMSFHHKLSLRFKLFLLHIQFSKQSHERHHRPPPFGDGHIVLGSGCSRDKAVPPPPRWRKGKYRVVQAHKITLPGMRLAGEGWNEPRGRGEVPGAQAGFYKLRAAITELSLQTLGRTEEPPRAYFSRAPKERSMEHAKEELSLRQRGSIQKNQTSSMQEDGVKKRLGHTQVPCFDMYFQEYDLVSPYEVDHNGDYVSHEITHPQRRKRALAQLGADSLHLRLKGFRHDFHLDLKTSSKLVAPGFLVQTLGKGGTKSVQTFPPEDFCFYQGSLRSHKNSSVALSTCKGLVLIKVPAFHVQPSISKISTGILIDIIKISFFFATFEVYIFNLHQQHNGEQVPTAHAVTPNGKSGMIRTQEADYFLKPLPSHLAGSPKDSAGGRDDGEKLAAGKPPPLTPRRSTPARRLQPQAPTEAAFLRKTQEMYPPKEDIFILPDEYKSCIRHKRSLLKSHRNEELNVETLVVVDKKMMQNHGHENITTYVLTILNMVSALFKDGTIGGNINIAIVGLILLEEEQPGLVISHHADHTLSSFCQWQSGLMGKDGTRHDHAILLTGLDICSWKNEPCDTLGFAPISGMCSKYRSCTINEDTGLGLAFTIAHESGHNFGMVHDGEGNVCKKSEGNIMSPTLAGRNGVFSWSPCSRQYLHKFLSTAQATCLADQPKPVKEYKYPEKLPGELYDANTQCKWQFGEKAKLCMLDFKKASDSWQMFNVKFFIKPFYSVKLTLMYSAFIGYLPNDICKALWCHRIGRKCETKFMPAAEGTTCGRDRWCRGGQCVKYGDEGPKPTHGHWSDWSPWSPCSRTCGGGVSHRDRLCTNPRPSNGGKFCAGSTRTLKLCNSQKCPHDSVDFRALQCAEYNSKRFRGWYYKWKPYTHVEDQDLCKLYCIAEGFDFFFSLSNKVKDGTPCSEDSRNVCIDGICERVGCDNVLGSDAVEDSCGVCRGSNSSCTTHKGLYAKQHRANQYYQMVIIPSGARSIRIYEMNVSTSYISVRNALKKYYLNGHWTVDWPGRYKFSGTAFDYRRSYREPESLTSPGPTNETLIVELLFQGRNPGVAWEYSVPRLGGEKKLSTQPSYTWATIRSECSVSCGGGRSLPTAILGIGTEFKIFERIYWKKFCCKVIYLNSLRKYKNFMKVAVKMTRNNMSKEEFHMMIDGFIILIP